MIDIEFEQDRGDIEFWTPETIDALVADLETGYPLVEVCVYCTSILEVETECKGVCYDGLEAFEAEVASEEAYRADAARAGARVPVWTVAR